MTLKNKKGYGVIYTITNLVNGKKYIGQTSKYYINDRWSQHKSYAKNNKDSDWRHYAGCYAVMWMLGRPGRNGGRPHDRV